MKWMIGLICLSSTAHAKPPSLTLSPKSIHPGEVALLKVTPAKDTLLASDLAATANEQTVFLWECPKKNTARCGLVSVPMEAKGSLPVTVKWTEGDQTKTETLKLRLTDKKYPRTKLKVEPGKTNPDPEEQKRIDQERAEFKAVYGAPEKKIFWDAPFKLPTAGKVTSVFGSQRVFNGEVKTTHFGVDLRAGATTPIYSGNAGKVVYAKEAFYGGNTVILDHGMGLFSSYNHLSSIHVAIGQILKRGDKIGMAGSTGRVTGPHLHWGVKVNGLSVDPMQMKKVFGKMFEAADGSKPGSPVAKND